MEIPETVRELEDAGTVKAVTLGAIASEIVIVVDALRLVETLPAASFA
jgi:hypothetical protein